MEQDLKKILGDKMDPGSLIRSQNATLIEQSDNVTMSWINATTSANATGTENNAMDATFQSIINIMLVVIVCVVMASLGCTIKPDVLKAQFRRPVGLIIGLVCQFIVYPAITFGLAHALKLEKWNAIGMILLGTSPGGSASNILTYYCEGEVTLSVCMTATSTLVGIGMMPLNAWLYSRSWADSKTVIPIESIMIGLASMLVPVAIGMLILAKLPKVAVWITRIGSALGLLMIFAVIGISSYLYPQMYSSPWQLWLASMLLPIFGLTIGYASSSIFCLPHPSRRAIAIETGCQNVALCLTLISVSYAPDVFLKVLVFPELYGVTGLSILLVLVVIYQIHKRMRRHLNNDKLTTEIEMSTKQDQYDVVDLDKITHENKKSDNHNRF